MILSMMKSQQNYFFLPGLASDDRQDVRDAPLGLNLGISNVPKQVESKNSFVPPIG